MAKSRKGVGPALMTRQELAAALGLHPQTITKWQEDGCPVARKGGRGVPSRYALPEVFAWRVETLRSVSETTLSLEQERQRLTRLNADRRELELMRERRELLPRDQIIRDGQTMVRGWSAMVRQIPRRFVHAGLIPRELEPAAKKLMYDLLVTISQWKTSADIEAAAARADKESR